MVLSIETIKKIYAAVGLTLFADGRVNIACFRGKERKANAFDDSLYTVRYDKRKDRWEIAKYRATVDPGLTQLQNPTFPEAQKNGTAIVCEHQTVNFKWETIGKGQYNHACLLQAEPIWLYRDKNKDDKLDFVNKELNPSAGICIHCFGNYGETERVNNRSAGCTDVWSWNEYKTRFIPSLKCNGQVLFPVSYFLEQDISNALNQK